MGIYKKIFDCIEEFIEELSPEISADIKRNGIMCVGGVSCVNGFVEYAIKRLNLPVYVADNPRDAVILGAGKLLSLNKEDYPYIKL